jgi:hypothetical protein
MVSLSSCWCRRLAWSACPRAGVVGWHGQPVLVLVSSGMVSLSSVLVLAWSACPQSSCWHGQLVLSPRAGVVGWHGQPVLVLVSSAGMVNRFDRLMTSLDRRELRLVGRHGGISAPSSGLAEGWTVGVN